VKNMFSTDSEATESKSEVSFLPERFPGLYCDVSAGVVCFGLGK
jgi:hypothetical protein